MGAAAILAPALIGAAVALKAKKDKTTIPSVNLPELVSEQTMEDATGRARRRRGLLSTLLTGDLSVSPENLEKKTLLGS